MKVWWCMVIPKHLDHDAIKNTNGWHKAHPLFLRLIYIKVYDIDKIDSRMVVEKGQINNLVAAHLAFLRRLSSRILSPV
jgi:hypothetical protein